MRRRLGVETVLRADMGRFKVTAWNDAPSNCGSLSLSCLVTTTRISSYHLRPRSRRRWLFWSSTRRPTSIGPQPSTSRETGQRHRRWRPILYKGSGRQNRPPESHGATNSGEPSPWYYLILLSARILLLLICCQIEWYTWCSYCFLEGCSYCFYRCRTVSSRGCSIWCNSTQRFDRTADLTDRV
jgi:hypothetical protein